MASKKIDTNDSLLDVSKLPDSYRFYYVNRVIDLHWYAIRNYYYKIRKTENEIYVRHSEILEYIFRYMINNVTKEVATKNPLEFMRYKKIISDAAFCIIFGLESSNINKSAFIDVLEEMLDSNEKLNITRCINLEEFVNLLEFKIACDKLKSENPKWK